MDLGNKCSCHKLSIRQFESGSVRSECRTRLHHIVRSNCIWKRIEVKLTFRVSTIAREASIIFCLSRSRLKRLKAQLSFSAWIDHIYFLQQTWQCLVYQYKIFKESCICLWKSQVLNVRLWLRNLLCLISTPQELFVIYCFGWRSTNQDKFAWRTCCEANFKSKFMLIIQKIFLEKFSKDSWYPFLKTRLLRSYDS